MEKHRSFIKWLTKNSYQYEAIFFDIDGTLVVGGKELRGAKKLLETLEKNNFPYLLLTNDANHSVEEKSRILAEAGLHVPARKFVSCGMALKIFVEKNNCGGQKFFVMGDLGKPCFAKIAGLKVERDPSKILSCNGVVVGEGIYDWQKVFFAVVNFFMKKPEAHLLVPNPDSYWPNGNKGGIGIGAGGKARFLCTILKENGINIRPQYFGKPFKMIYDFAMIKLKELYPNEERFKRSKILMLGDSLKSDIKGGNKFGFQSALILTGISKMSHLKKLDKSLTPDMVFDKLF
jgi:HAD superfamily hydrolase (TIGR01450 family)